MEECILRGNRAGSSYHPMRAVVEKVAVTFTDYPTSRFICVCLFSRTRSINIFFLSHTLQHESVLREKMQEVIGKLQSKRRRMSE